MNCQFCPKNVCLHASCAKSSRVTYVNRVTVRFELSHARVSRFIMPNGQSCNSLFSTITTHK